MTATATPAQFAQLGFNTASSQVLDGWRVLGARTFVPQWAIWALSQPNRLRRPHNDAESGCGRI